MTIFALEIYLNRQLLRTDNALTGIEVIYFLT